MGHVVCILAMLLALSDTAAQLRINEVHPTPPSGEPEWVELMNTGKTPLYIGSWYLCDTRSCVTLPAITVEPGGYVVLTRDAEALREVRIVEAMIIDCALPSLNNTSDIVVLRDADSMTVDSIAYRTEVRGRSIERGDDDWGPTYARDSATCGYLNSRVRLRHDLRLSGVMPGGPVPHLTVHVLQAGNTTSRERTITFVADSVNLRTTVPPLAPEASWQWTVPLDALPARGVLHCTVALSRGDDRAVNDTADAVIYVPPPTSLVSITEVMLTPLPHQCDYVEVHNGTQDTIDLDGWMLVDLSRDTVRATGQALVPPMGYGVIATDTTVRRMMYDDHRSTVALVRRSFNIDAGGEDVVLLNPSGFAVDVARCDPAMHIDVLADRRGVALEKLNPSLLGIDPSSWTSSGDLDGGTPGRGNSVGITLPVRTRGHLDVGTTQPYVIRYRQPFRHATAFMHVLSVDGAVIRTLLDNVVIGAEGAISWDGRDDAQSVVPRGPYIVSFTALDAASERVVDAVATVVASGRVR